MADLNPSSTTTTSLDNVISDYSVDAESLDSASVNDTTWDFPDASTNFGYYKTIPEFKKAVDALATWTAGKGYEVENDPLMEIILEHIKGWGEDTFQAIMWNMLVVKKVIGDSFAEIMKNKAGTIINLKPISPERMRIVVKPNGMIRRYEVQDAAGKYHVFKTKEILHLCNDRIADEIHGTSVLTACKWVIDARNEAMTDWRKVLHRNVVPVRIIEVDTDDAAKIKEVTTQYQEATKNFEALVIPKGTVTITDSTISVNDPIVWIRYLENFFYQAVGIPKIILGGSDSVTEASSKVGYLTFEPVYTQEQSLLEQDIWSQLAIRITFNRPASLGGTVQQDEEKNTGQVGFQPKEGQATVERE